MPNPEKDFDRLEQRFFDEWVRRNPTLGTSLGLHDFDEVMPDGSPQKELDDLKFLKRSLDEFRAFETKKLHPPRAVDRDLAIHTLQVWIFERQELRWSEINPEAPHVVGQALFQVLSRNYAPLKERLRCIIKRLERTPAYIEQARQKMKTPVKQYMESELETLSRLPGFFNMIKDVAREQIAVSAEKNLGRLIEDVQTALDEYENWLIVDAKPFYKDEWWIGDEKFRKLLAVRGIEESPLTMMHNAEAEMERLRERLREIGHQIKRKVMIEDIREIIRQQHADNIDAVLRYAREQMQKAKQFCSRSKFAPMPDHDQPYVTETPSFLCHVLPWGGYSGPAKFEPKHEGYFFVTPGDCDSDKLKEHNYAAVTNLTVHEMYPGHHMMAMWQARTASLSRLLFAHAPETWDGWAHYGEERVREMGFEDTPVGRFVMTLAALFRQARIVMDVKLSTGKMGYQEGVEYLIDNVGMDRVAAESEMRRYIVTPGIPLSQAYGKEKIKELRKWAKERMRGRWNETFFHHAVLLAGALPWKLLKRDVEWRVEEELKKPPEDDKHAKHAKHAAKDHAPAKAHAPAKPAAKGHATPSAHPPRRQARQRPAPRRPKGRTKARR